MRSHVLRSINDDTGQRCVDILSLDGDWGWVECRRDPEDSHGWRRLGVPATGYEDEEAALAAARARVGWLAGDTA